MREKSEEWTVYLVYKPTTDMPVDGLMKPLPLATFQRFIDLLGSSASKPELAVADL